MASIITTAGEQFLPAAAAGSAALTDHRIANQIIFANVDGLDHTATPSPDEQIPATVVHTAAITGYASTNDNNAIFTAILDSKTGDFSFNWLGLYNSEHDVLIQVAYEPLQEKYATDGSAIGNVLAKGMVLKIATAATAFDMTQAAQSWQVDFTGRQSAAENIQRNALAAVYGTGTYINDAGKLVPNAPGYRIEPGPAIIDGLRVNVPAYTSALTGSEPDTDFPVYVYAEVCQTVEIDSVDNVITVIESQDANLPATTGTHGETITRVKLASIYPPGAYTQQQIDAGLNIADERENVVTDFVAKRNATETTTGQTRYATTAEHEQREEKQAAATPGGVNELISAMFAGQVAHFPGTVPPSGWLHSKGQTVDRSDYPYLWAYAKNSGNIAATEGAKTDGQFGPGDGSTTFTLPDLRGVHIRNWDDGKGTDTGREIGTSQSDQNKSHSHGASTNTTGSHSHSASTGSAGSHSHSIPVTQRNLNSGNVTAGSKVISGSLADNKTETTNSTNSAGSHSHSVSVGSNGNHSHTVTVNADGGTETRVKNIALMACIKY